MKDDEINKNKNLLFSNDYEELSFIMEKTFELEDRMWTTFFEKVKKRVPKVGMAMFFSCIDEKTGKVYTQQYQYGDFDALTEVFFNEMGCKTPMRQAYKARIEKVLKYFFRERGCNND